MVENGTSNLVLRPGINEVVLIHEDQQATQRYVHDVWIEHNGVQIPLAPKSIPWGQVTDKTTMKPIYNANVGVSGNGVSDLVHDRPVRISIFFESLADGTYSLTANAAGYKQKTANVSVALGTAATEVVQSTSRSTWAARVRRVRQRAERRLPRPVRSHGRVRRDLHRPDCDLRQRRLRPESVRHADVLARLTWPGRDAGDAACADRAVRSRTRARTSAAWPARSRLGGRLRDRQLRRGVPGRQDLQRRQLRRLVHRRALRRSAGVREGCLRGPLQGEREELRQHRRRLRQRLAAPWAWADRARPKVWPRAWQWQRRWRRRQRRQRQLERLRRSAPGRR